MNQFQTSGFRFSDLRNVLDVFEKPEWKTGLSGVMNFLMKTVSFCGVNVTFEPSCEFVRCEKCHWQMRNDLWSCRRPGRTAE